MDYYLLLDMVTELGYQLAMSGAETFRVEESVHRVMGAYGIEAEVFAIPNCLHVSIETDKGKPMTLMRRIGFHGNDLDAVEQFSNLSRKLCAETPAPEIGKQWLKDTKKACRKYTLPMSLLGHTLGAGGYAIIFGGSLRDCLCAAVCGIAVCLVSYVMDKWKANQFFRIIAASFIMALLAYFSGSLGLAANADSVIIGTLMILLPGLVFTNALRDIIYGDTNSGINRIVQVILVAAAIALGTGAAFNLTNMILGVVDPAPVIAHPLIIEALACFIGCTGFFIVFNIHGYGSFLCALGGMLTWIAYRIFLKLGCGDITANFFATMVGALYSEVMARIRKYPAISYLVISLFPLIPGAGVYYTTNYLVRGDMTGFAAKGMHTLGVAGALAVGILLISTIFRFISMRKNPPK